MITLFFAEPVLVQEGVNGDAWVLRAYESLADLKPVQKHVDFSIQRERFSSIRWRPSAARNVFLAADYPSAYDLPEDFQRDERLVDEWSYDVSPYESSKIGGWPYLLQGPLEWPVTIDAMPEFALQLSGFNADTFPFQDMIYYIARARGGQDSEWLLTSHSA